MKKVRHPMTVRDERVSLLGRGLILVGLGLLLLWPLRSLIATTVWNNVGSVHLSRALLAPGLEPEERWAWAVKAGQSFQTALAWDPLNGQAYYNLAAIYDGWQDTPSAARALSRAAVLNPQDANTRFKLGQALAAQGASGGQRLEERAIEEWRAAGAAAYFVNQGLALAHAGDQEGALAQYERAVAIDPNLPGGQYRLGQALSRLGREEEAVAAFESAAALEPASSPRRYLLQGEVHAARGEWAAALAAFGQAAELAEGDPAPHYQMGWVYDQGLGDREAAIAHFQWALQLDPDHIPSRLALGQLYEKQGECDEVAYWLAPLLAPARGGGEAVGGQAHALLGSCLVSDKLKGDHPAEL